MRSYYEGGYEMHMMRNGDMLVKNERGKWFEVYDNTGWIDRREVLDNGDKYFIFTRLNVDLPIEVEGKFCIIGGIIVIREKEHEYTVYELSEISKKELLDDTLESIEKKEEEIAELRFIAESISISLPAVLE